MPHAVPPRSAAARAPLPTAVAAHRASTGDSQTLKGWSGSVSVGSLGPSAHTVLFESSEHLWWVWRLILNVVSPLLPFPWGFSFALGEGASFFGRIQHSPVDGCSAVLQYCSSQRRR